MRFILVVVLALLVASASSARDLFTIDTGALGISGSGNSVVDLVDDLINQNGDFTGLALETSYTGTLDYLGVPNAVAMTLDLADPAMPSLVLAIPSIGASETFDGTSLMDLQGQIEDWVKQSGTATWAEFLEAMNGASALALLDGNPRASTALMANSAYRRFGLNDSRSRLGYMEQEVARFGTFGVTLEVGAGTASTDQFSGLDSIDGSLEISGEFNDTVGLAFSVITQYRDYNSAELYDVGVEIGLPIRLRRPVEGKNLYWGVTPVLQAGAGVSPDVAAGGLFLGGGLVNSTALQLGIFEIGMGNELIYYGGIPINDIKGYDFETELDQLIMKNGLRIALRPTGLFYAEGGVTITNFLLDDAALDYYATPFVGAGLRLGRYVELRASYEADLGKQGYRGQRGRLELGAYF